MLTMLSRSFILLLSTVCVDASVIRQRQDPGFQTIPSSANPPGQFSNGAPELVAEPPVTSNAPPDVYGARQRDLPFNRLYYGNMNFFSQGELNTPTGDTDQWGAWNDNANQSACGIPDNAFVSSKVAIHPYFLKYADLSRYCMQDVCISFWKEDGTSDMMLKVTDICSTDPNDPTSCKDPSDIKIERSKAGIMEQNAPASAIAGNQYPGKVWWFFMKCWDDGLAQPAYQNDYNWFTTPPLPNNLDWAQKTATQQYENNQISYKAAGWQTYPNGGYNTTRDSAACEITDWVAGQEPSWSPIAGGKGFGTPKGGSMTTESNDTAPIASTIAPSSTSTNSYAGAEPAPSSTSASSNTGSGPAAFSSTSTPAAGYQLATTSSSLSVMPIAASTSSSDSTTSYDNTPSYDDTLSTSSAGSASPPAASQSNSSGSTSNHGTNDMGTNDWGDNDYGSNDHGNNDYGSNDCGDNRYGSNLGCGSGSSPVESAEQSASQSIEEQPATESAATATPYDTSYGSSQAVATPSSGSSATVATTTATPANGALESGSSPAAYPPASTPTVAITATSSSVSSTLAPYPPTSTLIGATTTTSSSVSLTSDAAPASSSSTSGDEGDDGDDDSCDA